MTTAQRRGCCLLLCVFVVGCDQDAPATSATASMDTLSPAVTIGDVDTFGRINAVLLDADGNVLIADGQAQAVATYAPDGTHVRTSGRQGEGPGEFRGLNSLGMIGDTVMALDGGNARISLMSRDGENIGSWTWLPISGPPSVVRFYPAGPHESYVLGLGRPGPRYIRVSASGPGDTVSFSVPSPPESASRSGSGSLECPRPDDGITFFSTPFASRTVSAPADDGLLATAWTDLYRVVFTDAGGDTVKSVERDYQPLPVTDKQWSAATADFEQFQADWPTVRCTPAGMTRPESHAAIEGIFFDYDGNLVVEVHADGVTRFDHYDAEGNAAGTSLVNLRDASVPPYFRDPWIAQVVKDSLDVQSVEVYRRSIQ